MAVSDQWFAATSAAHLEKVAVLADQAVARAQRRVSKVQAELDAAEAGLREAQTQAEAAHADAEQARGAVEDSDLSRARQARDVQSANDVTANANVAQMKTES